MTARTAWFLEHLPWLAARRPRTSAEGTPDGEVITLSSWSACSLEVRRGRTVEVRCVAGLAHATFEGDPADHILRAGESLRVVGPGRLALVGLEPSRLWLRESRRERTADVRRAA